MAENTLDQEKFKILFVGSTVHPVSENVISEIIDLDFRPDPLSFDAQENFDFLECECVVERVDPKSRVDLEQLKAILRAATQARFPVVGMSTFDASWVENLMALSGVERYFRRILKCDVISLVISQFKKPPFERLAIVGT